MNPVVSACAAAAIGLLAGSFPTGYFAGRIKGLDIRRLGSRNIGFTNVYRTVGAAWAVPVLIIDVLKGLLPVLLARQFGLVPAAAGLGAVVGHVFTPWLGFRGGKGVATTIGVLAALSPRVALAGLSGYTLALVTTGFISVGSLLFAAIIAPLTAMLYRGDVVRLVAGALMGVIIIVRHAANLNRLMRGVEPRFGLWLRLFRRTR
ncbi:MAG: glycerol-3-phosphate 1-O-acyltransferase PlsY [bacterium]